MQSSIDTRRTNEYESDYFTSFVEQLLVYAYRIPTMALKRAFTCHLLDRRCYKFMVYESLKLPAFIQTKKIRNDDLYLMDMGEYWILQIIGVILVAAENNAAMKASHLGIKYFSTSLRIFYYRMTAMRWIIIRYIKK